MAGVSDLCEADSCGAIFDIFDQEFGDYEQLKDCTIAKGFAAAFALRKRVCAMSPLDIGCQLSTFSVDMRAKPPSVGFDAGKCDKGVRKFTCGVDMNGICTGRDLTCANNASRDLAASLVRAFLENCVPDMTVDKCKTKVLALTAQIKNVFSDAVLTAIDATPVKNPTCKDDATDCATRGGVDKCEAGIRDQTMDKCCLCGGGRGDNSNRATFEKIDRRNGNPCPKADNYVPSLKRGAYPTLQKCQAQCEREITCKFFSFKDRTCLRYGSNTCGSNSSENGYSTYKKTTSTKRGDTAAAVSAVIKSAKRAYCLFEGLQTVKSEVVDELKAKAADEGIQFLLDKLNSLSVPTTPKAKTNADTGKIQLIMQLATNIKDIEKLAPLAGVTDAEIVEEQKVQYCAAEKAEAIPDGLNAASHVVCGTTCRGVIGLAAAWAVFL